MSKVTGMIAGDPSNGLDLAQRDPNNLNEHLQVDTEDDDDDDDGDDDDDRRWCGTMCSESLREWGATTAPGEPATNASTALGMSVLVLQKVPSEGS